MMVVWLWTCAIICEVGQDIIWITFGLAFQVESPLSCDTLQRTYKNKATNFEKVSGQL